jgi:hypothetical protein
MVMVGHEAVGVANPIVAFVDVQDGIQEVLAVGVILEDGLLLVSARGHMIDCTGVFNAKRTCHGGTIAEKGRNDNKVDLTLRGPDPKRS